MSPLGSRLAEWLRPSGREKASAKKIWRKLEKGRIVAVVHLSDHLDIELEYDTQF